VISNCHPQKKASYNIFLISKSNSLKEQRGATLGHRKHTRELLMYRKRSTKLQKPRELEIGKLSSDFLQYIERIFRLQ
jgi:hypothetical protein